MMVALLLAFPGAEWVVWSIYPNFGSLAKYLNAGIFCGIAIFTGARLADAGYRRWLGVAGVVLIGVGGPIVTAFVAILVWQLQLDEFRALAPPVVVAWTLLLIAFVIWAGTRRPIPRASIDDVFHDDSGGDHPQRRIEPRF
jgi:ABC-type transport system involved in cytochrome c biogenesis permease subunit